MDNDAQNSATPIAQEILCRCACLKYVVSLSATRKAQPQNRGWRSSWPVLLCYCDFAIARYEADRRAYEIKSSDLTKRSVADTAGK